MPIPNLLKKLVLAVIVMTLSAAAFWPGVRNGFAWDDYPYIVQNPQVRDFSAAGLKRIFTTVHFGLYKPVAIASFSLNYKFAALNPAPYHVTNILLHSVNAGLVFLLIFLLVRSTGAAFLCALFFGIHPMRVESVVWISERKDVLYALFFLLSSIFYIRFVESGRTWQRSVSVFCFAVSLLVKPMGITLPAILLVYDYMLGRRFDRRLFFEKMSYLVIATVFTGLTYYFLKADNQVRFGYSLSDRFFFVFYGLQFYARKLFYPVNLSSLYPFPVRSGGPLPAEYLVSPVLVLSAAALVWLKLRHYRFLTAGLLFYVGTVFPVLQFLPVGPAVTADRYTYIPSLGLFLPVAVALVWCFERLRAKSSVYALAAGIAVSGVSGWLFFESRQRCLVWYDDEMLFADAAMKYPDITNIKHLAMSLRGKAKPEVVFSLYNKALVVAGPTPIGSNKFAEVVDIYIIMAEDYIGLGNYAHAEKILLQLLRYTPQYPPLQHQLAMLMARSGQTEEAVKMLEIAADNSLPMLQAEAYGRIGRIYEDKRDYVRAREYYAKALSRNPWHESAYSGMQKLNQLRYMSGVKNKE